MPLQETGDMRGSNMRQICGFLVIQKHQANRRHLQQVYFTVMEKKLIRIKNSVIPETLSTAP